MSEVVAFMGGTFDPIHNGHLRTALEIRQFLRLKELRLIPCDIPTHRDHPGSSASQRLAMLELAVSDEPGLVADDREIRSDDDSYTIHTLRSLRAEVSAETSLIMVLGTDSFLSLSKWRDWQAFLQFAHILVVQRPGYEFDTDSPLYEWVKRHRVDDPVQLKSQSAGSILFHSLTPLGISATQIRELVQNHQSPRYLLPDRVWRYIREQGLYGYQPEGSGF